MKKIVVVMVTVLMILALMPLPALAADGTISSNSTHDLSEYGNDSTITINAGLTVTLTNTGDVTYTNMKIVCGAGVSLTLSGVKIDNSATSGACALKFSGSGNTLAFTGNTYLTSGEFEPGISVMSGVSLQINGTGTLDVIGGSLAAGIGCSYNAEAGSITISGGDVETNGGDFAAGIGGGNLSSGGSITISGGIVTARGYSHAAGIGGGNGGSGGTINITGGTVTAEGGASGAGIGTGYNVETNTTVINISGGNITAGCEGTNGAGIGGGEYSPGGTINISGGTVTAKGGTEAAGIGGGYYGNGGSITITSGTITATGGTDGGAGIGSGDGSDGSNGVNGGTINILGGTVKAYGGGSSGLGQYGAGIGGGDYCAGGIITISGNADVTAEGGIEAAGIGGGYEGDGGVITIKGSVKVTATGGMYGAGIGSGYTPYNDDADTKITISENADVTATGGTYSAGIGGGCFATGGTIEIAGGTVSAQGGNEAAGIGGGSSEGCNVTIQGGTVVATGGSTGSGIGSGEQAEDTGSVTITGGSVSAQGGTDGAGIGGGYYSGGGTIHISGGTVAATGGNNGAGIGSGCDASSEGKDGGDITIEGDADVTTTGGEYGAGIGGGQYCSGGTINISGTADVTAYGGGSSENDSGYSGAGIGGGYYGHGGEIHISGGTVTAMGGDDSAAIGGGDGGDGGTITISGGIVYAIKHTEGTCDIGHGGGSDGSISISDTAAVLLGTDTISPSPPTTMTHTHYIFTEDTEEAYGIDIPTEWMPTFGAYLVLCDLDYNDGGGTGTVPDSSTQAVGSKIVVAANTLTNSGYEFNGWNTAEDGSGDAYDPGDMFTFPVGDTTLYAQWKIADGVQTGSLGALLSDGSGNPLAGYTIELHSTVKTGVTDASGKVTFDIVPYADHTLVIKNSSNTILATFNLNMTSGAMGGYTLDGSNINVTFTEDTVAIQISLSYDGEVVSVEDVTIVENPDTGDSSGWLIWVAIAALMLMAAAAVAVKKRSGV